jgi:nitroreductase
MRLLRQRRSCRSFAPDPVDETALQILAEAFSLAPQAGGERNLRCAFITDRAAIRGLAERGMAAFAALCENMASPFFREETARYGERFFWFGEAPALAVVSCRRPPAFLTEMTGDKAPLVWGGELSAAMAAFALLLAAESAGLGACPLTGPLVVWHKMETLLELPGRDALVLLVALGHKK